MIRTQYLVTLTPIDNDVPSEVRLRRLLKAMLRSYGLRCVSVALDASEQIGMVPNTSDTSELLAATERAQREVIRAATNKIKNQPPARCGR